MSESATQTGSRSQYQCKQDGYQAREVEASVQVGERYRWEERGTEWAGYAEPRPYCRWRYGTGFVEQRRELGKPHQSHLQVPDRIGEKCHVGGKFGSRGH